MRGLSADFDAMYAKSGRPSIPPERLLKGSLLIAMYSVRSERQFCERLGYDMLFKWFLEMNIEDAAFDPTSFTRTETGSCSTRWRPASSRRSARRRSGSSSSVTTTSRSTAACSRPGRRSRASSQ